ncbi:SidA/IucD/PvdA family monooxygenase [Cryobacterium lyxosi]|uniref:SidA/IucD/PvdA family monooxygenase n=1 Tax=Cryobacterium lyxosi TaxID=1259228 RepID=UPI001F5406DF|nr:SidA/IucD/PvdA family monooxygenase [Cryobacterium lyxosi]
MRLALRRRDGQRCEIVVTAAGHLSDPKLPNITGLEKFERPMFHSARWDHSFKREGKSIGVIGSGASGIQIVPELAKTAGQLTVFQRSAPYISDGRLVAITRSPPPHSAHSSRSSGLHEGGAKSSPTPDLIEEGW